MVLGWLRKRLRCGRNKEPKGLVQQLWSQHYKHFDVEMSHARISSCLRVLVDSGEVELGRLAWELNEMAAAKHKWSDRKGQTIRWLMLEMVDMFASYRYDDRFTFRAILTILFSHSQCIEREVLFFDHARGPIAAWNGDKEAKDKLNYVLSQVACWDIPMYWPCTTSGLTARYYLEMPLKRAFGDEHTTLMGEALFRLQDADLTLNLLRCGVKPSCLYLWPMLVMIDFRLTLQEHGQNIDNVGLEESLEYLAIRYFCRARSWFRILRFQAEDDRSILEEPGVDGNQDCEDMLLLPERAKDLVPADRHLEPASLSHQARLVIRDRLARTDRLPHGPQLLPLPQRLKDYVDLLLD